MSLPGPSSLGRLVQCMGSEALPHARSSSIAAQRGTIIHAFLADVLRVGRAGALEMAPEDAREGLAVIQLDRLPPLDSAKNAAEVSFALNIETGEARELGRNLSRDEARGFAQTGEMVGTADLVGIAGDTAVIVDWKTGYRTDAAAARLQVSAYALMAARAYGKSGAACSVVRITEDGTPWADSFTLDGLDLDAVEAEIRALMAERERVRALPFGERPPLHEGEHCRFCPALPYCPAKVTLLATAFDEHDMLSDDVLDLTPGRAASAWQKIQGAKKLLERLEAVLEDYAREHPFPVGEGCIVGEVTEHRESLVAERARAALERHFGAQLAAAVYQEAAETKTVLTKTALKAALRRHVLPTVPGANITGLHGATLEKLRAAGAVSVASYRVVREHKPKAVKELPAPSLPSEEREPGMEG